MKLRLLPASPTPRRIVAAWSELVAEMAHPNAFYAPGALGPARAHLDPRRRVRLLVGEGSGGRLDLVLPVVPAALPVPALSAWQHPYAFLTAPLVRPGRAAAAAVALRALRWPVVLPVVSADDPLVVALLTDASVARVARGERALLEVPGDPDAHLASVWSSRRRRRARRALRDLEGAGRVAWTVGADPASVAPLVADFLALEARGWKGRAGTAMACDPAHQAFLEDLALARGGVSMEGFGLSVGGRTVAVQLHLRAGRALYGLKMAYDEADADAAPGVLLQAHVLRALLTDPTIDWVDSCSAPDHPVLDRLWGGRRRLVQIAIPPPGGSGRAWRRAWTVASAARDELRPRLAPLARRLRARRRP